MNKKVEKNPKKSDVKKSEPIKKDTSFKKKKKMKKKYYFWNSICIFYF